MPPDIPLINDRLIIWVVAELHLLFAAFVLGAPIFIVVCEYLGLRSGDARYERLARETMKIVAISYSITALFGGAMTFVLVGKYQELSNFLFQRFYPVFGLYAILLLVESSLMYVYWYTWDALAQRKSLHISIGVALNVVGTVVMVLMNGVGSFMLTPPDSPTTASLWQLINNATWTGLNLHRFIANISFGGFMVALFAALMFFTSKAERDRAFYDWMGYIGNFIGVAGLIALPVAGYIYTREIFAYNAQISTLLMADKLAWFFVIQGVLVGLLLLGAIYYMWLSIRRIEGGVRFQTYFRGAFWIALIGFAVWLIPQSFLPSLTSRPVGPITEVVIPEKMIFLGLMPAKGLAVSAMVVVTAFVYFLYRQAIATGKMAWGQIDVKAQLVLAFLPSLSVFTMALMGSVREMARGQWHIFQFMPDNTPYSFITPLGYAAAVSGIVTIIFFALMFAIFWLGFRVGHQEEAP
ncbi:MAG: cytochrome ubiquinol oxidase subunit I [Dehalococcoidales bacterium]|nr:cytochrome ubiquinol oxidase subunit I [Dehalococcoidales bacterium]